MKKFAKHLAATLSLAMMLLSLAACGGNDANQTPKETAPTETTAAPVETTPPPSESPSESVEPEASVEPVSMSDATYGGILIDQIMNYIGTYRSYGHDIRVKAFGEANADWVKDEFESEWYKYSRTKTPDEVVAWLDRVFLRPSETDYTNATQDEIDEARNMVVVLLTANMNYIPSQVPLDAFFGDGGMEIYRRWREKPETNQGDVDPIDSEPAGSPGDKTGDFTLVEVTDQTKNIESTGDLTVNVTVNCPDLAGTETVPSFVFLLMDDDGQIIRRIMTYSGPSDTDKGSYTYYLSVNQRQYAEDGESYTIVPIKNHVYAFRIIPGSDVSLNALTADQCVLIY